MSFISADDPPTDHHPHPGQPSVPPEIWLHILPYLDSADLEAASLTCSTFRYIAQPLLFSVLDVSPFFLAYNTDKPVLRQRNYLRWTQARLERFKLPHIAPAVKHCWISPYSRNGFPPRSHRDDLDPSLIVDLVISALSSFPNLNTLSWHCINIQPQWWSVIETLPLTHLWINSSVVLSLNPSPLRAITYLDLDQWAWEGQTTNFVSIHEERLPGVDQQLLPLIIHPETIQSISVPRLDTAKRLLFTLSGMSTNLRVLRIPFAAMVTPFFVDALVQCHNLEELRILPPAEQRPHDEVLQELPLSALPTLSVYEGPYSHLFGFAHRPLKGVILWGFDDHPTSCDPKPLHKMMDQVAETCTRDTLELLQLSITRITLELLVGLSSFPNLTSVAIESQDDPPESNEANIPFMDSALHIDSHSPITILYLLLRGLSLPRSLQHLRFTTRLNSGNLDAKTQEREASRFAERLARKHPELKVIEVAYGAYWTGMYTTEWVRAMEDPPRASDTNETRLRDLAAHIEEVDDAINSHVGESFADTSKLTTDKKGIVSTRSRIVRLPLGTLTFTEHQRTGIVPDTEYNWGDPSDVRKAWSFEFMWQGLRQFFGQYLYSG